VRFWHWQSRYNAGQTTTHVRSAWFGAWLVPFLSVWSDTVGQLKRSDVRSGGNSIPCAAGFSPRTKLVRPVRRRGHRCRRKARLLGSRLRWWSATTMVLCLTVQRSDASVELRVGGQGIDGIQSTAAQRFKLIWLGAARYVKQCPAGPRLIPDTRMSTVGRRGIYYACPAACNSLPPQLTANYSLSLTSFKEQLKTFLFR